MAGSLPGDPPAPALGLPEFRAGLARLNVLPPVVLYDEHWASIVVAGAGAGGGPPALRRVDLQQFVALCRRLRARDGGVCIRDMERDHQVGLGI